MKLYLVFRHAEAIERSGTTPERSRYLTSKGRLAFRKIARHVRKAGIAPAVIFTSPRCGSRKTAEILAEALKHKAPGCREGDFPRLRHVGPPLPADKCGVPRGRRPLWGTNRTWASSPRR